MSTSQLGEFPQVDQNMVSCGSQSRQVLSGGMSLVVGRNSDMYLVARHMLRSWGHISGRHLSNISVVESSDQKARHH